MPALRNPTTGDAQLVKRHTEYFFSEGDVTFRIENTIFRVHKRFFFRESSYFRSLFNSPTIPCSDPPGSSETNPVVLKDLTPDAFAWLLWVFYNPKYSIYSTTVDNWVRILDLAQKWGFKEVESLCVRELEKLPIPPVDKIHVYQQFKLDRSLLLESFARLTTRSEPLTLEEGQSLGLETSLETAQARELYRGLQSGSKHSVVPSSELQSVVREVFKLSDEGEDSSQQQHPVNDNHNRKHPKK